MITIAHDTWVYDVHTHIRCEHLCYDFLRVQTGANIMAKFMESAPDGTVDDESVLLVKRFNFVHKLALGGLVQCEQLLQESFRSSL